MVLVISEGMPKAEAVGPQFVRNAQVKLVDINVDSVQTGHRSRDLEQIECLKNKFLGGEFGRTVACGVQLLEDEENGKKLLDDGLSTVIALQQIQEEYWRKDADAKPNGDLWDSQLVDIFQNGLVVKIVAYPENSDREVREAWNIAKHDKESVSVAWSTVFAKVNIAKKRYGKTNDWGLVAKWLCKTIGGGEKSKGTVGRWVRAAAGLDDEVLLAMKDSDPPSTHPAITQPTPRYHPANTPSNHPAITQQPFSNSGYEVVTRCLRLGQRVSDGASSEVPLQDDTTHREQNLGTARRRSEDICRSFFDQNLHAHESLGGLA